MEVPDAVTARPENYYFTSESEREFIWGETANELQQKHKKGQKDKLMFKTYEWKIKLDFETKYSEK